MPAGQRAPVVWYQRHQLSMSPSIPQPTRWRPGRGRSSVCTAELRLPLPTTGHGEDPSLGPGAVTLRRQKTPFRPREQQKPPKACKLPPGFTALTSSQGPVHPPPGWSRCCLLCKAAEHGGIVRSTPSSDTKCQELLRMVTHKVSPDFARCPQMSETSPAGNHWAPQ